MPSVQFKSQITQTTVASPEEARRHFGGKLSLETDPSDVHFDLSHRLPGVVVIDARSQAAYAELHVPGAASMPYATIDETTVEALRGRTVVVYCWSASCNAAAKAALRLAALGVAVKEMIGGLEAWVREGYPTEGALPSTVPFEEYLRHHHARAGRAASVGASAGR